MALSLHRKSPEQTKAGRQTNRGWSKAVTEAGLGNWPPHTSHLAELHAQTLAN